MWWCCVQSQLEDWSTHNRFIFYYKIALFSIYVNMHTCTFVHMCVCVSACACVLRKGRQIPRSWSYRWLGATWHAGKWTLELRSSARVASSSNQGAMSLAPVHDRLLYNVIDYIAHVTRLKVRWRRVGPNHTEVLETSYGIRKLLHLTPFNLSLAYRSL